MGLKARLTARLWRSAERRHAIRSVDLTRPHRPPAGGDGFGLGAEPALALVGRHADLSVPGAPGHVVDPAVSGEVALDAAACGCLGLSHGPTLGVELPGRH